MVWLDLHAKFALNTGTPSVEAHWGAVETKKFKYGFTYYIRIYYHFTHSVLGTIQFDLHGKSIIITQHCRICQKTALVGHFLTSLFP